MSTPEESWHCEICGLSLLANKPYYEENGKKYHSPTRTTFDQARGLAVCVKELSGVILQLGELLNEFHRITFDSFTIHDQRINALEADVQPKH